VIVAMERAVMKLQLLIDRIRNATYGYAGLFDAIKVDEAALDALYDFDQSMLEGAEQLKTQIDQMENLAGSEQLTLAEANELVASVQTLNDTFTQRQDVLLA
jgi:hypothetical protein